MASFSSWFKLDFDKIAPAISPESAGWARQTPSPYDVPTHGRAMIDNAAGVLVIQFRYISDEAVTKIRMGEYLDASIGKKTRRIFEVRFRVRDYHRDKGMKSPSLDSEAMSQVMSMSSTSNGLIASRAVDQNRNALFELSGAL